MILPDLTADHALFLDLDGTLLEIAATPDLVVVPPTLPLVLDRARSFLDGALAIASGRSLATIDQLLKPYIFAAAGEHGAGLRFNNGAVEEMPEGLGIPREWSEALDAAASQWRGMLIEPKPHGVAVHYRLVPERRDDIWKLVRSLVTDDHPWFRLIPAREAIEIGPRSVSKGYAVDRLMNDAAFRGRRPIFVGDDFTDEAGMSAAIRHGGMGLRVREAFKGDPALVRAWLGRNIERRDKSEAALPAEGAAG